MWAVCVRGSQLSGLISVTVTSYPGRGISLLLGEGGGGAYVQDKNTSAVLCAKNAGRAYAREGAYLRDTTVYYKFYTTNNDATIRLQL